MRVSHWCLDMVGSQSCTLLYSLLPCAVYHGWPNDSVVVSTSASLVAANVSVTSAVVVYSGSEDTAKLRRMTLMEPSHVPMGLTEQEGSMAQLAGQVVSVCMRLYSTYGAVPTWEVGERLTVLARLPLATQGRHHGSNGHKQAIAHGQPAAVKVA